jgi:catechol 2,3-dioxygenase-like lactoylglutathione lyase family enzyme
MDRRVLAAVAVAAGAVVTLLRPRPVIRVVQLSRGVGDLARAETFYRQALGFRPIARWSRDDAAFGRLLGMAGIGASAVVLGLGDERLELVSYQPAGRAYPAVPANDTRFQHAAIIVSDMAAAWGQVTQARGVAISAGGPQALPGGLLACKFRDPDGHPLELLESPPGQGRARWHQAAAPLFQGIDHSALTVRDTAASLRFYRDLLGLVVSSRSLNQGLPQQALDGIAGPLVRVTQLRPGDRESPRIELLHYLAPPAAPNAAPAAANDIAKDRLLLQVRDIDRLFARLVRAGVAFVSPGLVPFDGGRAMLVRDSDGHDLLLTG